MSNSPIYVAKVLVYGPNGRLRAMLAHAQLNRVVRRDGDYAVMGNRLLQLCGWTPCGMTAEAAAQANSESPGDVALLKSWPHDVSGWQQIRFSDAPSPLHMSPEVIEELSHHGR